MRGLTPSLPTNYGSGGTAGTSTTFWNYDPLRGWLDNKRYDNGSGAQGLGPDYSYTNGGRLASRKWARTGTNGQRMTTSYVYDFAQTGNTSRTGDLKQVLYSNQNTSAPDFNLSYSQKRWGGISSLIDVLGARTFAYRESDDLRLETEDSFGRRITRTYDSQGRPSEVHLGTELNPTEDHVSGQTYDAQTGRFDKITHGAVTAADAEFAYGYRANSHLVQSISVQNQVSGSFVANHTVTNLHETYRDLVTRTSASAGTVDRSRNDYVYNAIGQRTRHGYRGSIMGGFDGSFYYHFNSKGELAKTQRHASPNTTHTGSYSHTWDYDFDGIGNRLSETFQAATTTYNPNVLNQYDDISTGGVTVSKSHDDDGNLIDDGLKTYEWDGENRLRRVSRKSDGTQLAVYFYDYQGRRIYKNTTAQADGGASSILFIYDGWNLLAEYDYGETVDLLRKYTWGKDLSGSKQGAGGVGGLLCVEDANGKHYPTYDANGNVVGVIKDDAGATGEAYYVYDGFGKTFQSGGAYKDSMKFRFSTKYYDEETGFYYYGYRYYDPVTGRWPSRDPIEERGGVNLYGFVGNDGGNSWDYLGLERELNINVDDDGRGLNFIFPEGESEFGIFTDEKTVDEIFSEEEDRVVSIHYSEEGGISFYETFDDEEEYSACQKKRDSQFSEEMEAWKEVYERLAIILTIQSFVRPKGPDAGKTPRPNINSTVQPLSRTSVVLPKGVSIIDDLTDGIVISMEVKVGTKIGTITGNFTRVGSSLFVKECHVAGDLTVKYWHAFYSQLASSNGVSRILIQGGKRTTGARIGQYPRPFIVHP